MPQLIQHIPIERDGVPAPQTLAPILKAAQPGTVTLVCSDSSAISLKSLFSLTVELARTQKVTFANFIGQSEMRNPANLLGVVNGLAGVWLGMTATELTNKLIRRQLTEAEYTTLYALPLERIFVKDGFPLTGGIVSGFPEWLIAPDNIEPDSGALVIDSVDYMHYDPEWLRLIDTAKTNNFAVIAQLFVTRDARDAGSYDLIPELTPKSNQIVENADAVFVFHDNEWRR